MLKIFALIALVLVLSYEHCESLECYTGFSMTRGRTVGTTKEHCKKPTDQCYKASAEVNILSKLKLAGCSTHRCKASSNRCSSHNIGGRQFELCCCNTDLCNTRQSLAANGTATGVINQLKNLKDMIPG